MPAAASSVAIAVAAAASGDAAGGVNVAMLLRASGSNPVPVMLITSPVELPAGETDAVEPAEAVCRLLEAGPAGDDVDPAASDPAIVCVHRARMRTCVTARRAGDVETRCTSRTGFL